VATTLPYSPPPPFGTSAVRLSSSRPLLLAAAAAAAAVFCSSRRAHKLNAQTSFASHLEDKLKKGGQQQQPHRRGRGKRGGG